MSYRADCSGEGDWAGQLDDGEVIILVAAVVAGVGGPGGRVDPQLPVSYTVVVLPHHHLDGRRKMVSRECPKFQNSFFVQLPFVHPQTYNYPHIQPTICATLRLTTTQIYNSHFYHHIYETTQHL